jgi:hypothetical protein
MQRTYVDFNTETSTPIGLLKLYHPEVSLHDGEVAIAFDDEMEVQARVHQDAESGLWLVQPDWQTRDWLTQE